MTGKNCMRIISNPMAKDCYLYKLYSNSEDTETVDVSEFVYIKTYLNKHNKTLVMRVDMEDVKRRRMVLKMNRMSEEWDPDGR